jgi:muramidase (phage lysozyme)
MTNHLGNVLTVIHDIKIPLNNGSGPAVSSYRVGIRNSTDYSPFGVELDGRTVSLEGYRFGFQDQEKDDEIKGEGNSINYTFRMHDPRLGRFFAVDPLAKRFPHNSAFAFSENRVIDCGELEGLQIFYAADGTRIGQFGSSTQVRVVQNKDVEAFKKEFYNARHSQNEYNRIKTNIENNAYSSGLSNAKMILNRHAKVSMNFQNKVLVEMSEDLGMTEKEMNLRATLSTLKQAEAGRLNKPLDYNSWNGTGQKFTQDEYKINPDAYENHPGANPKNDGSTAAGAYQFLKRFYNMSTFSPANQDKAAVKLMNIEGYNAAINGDMVAFKSAMSGRWTSLNHWTSKDLKKEFKSNVIKELNGNSKIQADKGTLLRNN